MPASVCVDQEQGNNSSSRREAQVLFDALEGFIRITVHKHTQESAKKLNMAGGSALPQSQASPTGGLASTMPSGRLEVDKEVHTQLPTSSGSEAQTLLNALEAFIQSNVHDQLAQRGTQKSDEKLGSSESTNHEGLWVDGLLGNAPLNSDSPGEEQSNTPEDTPAPRLPQKLMDGLRECVFNQMPIRLLTVGPEIKLLERSEVFQHIVLKMRLIDETAFKRMVPSKISKVEQQVIEDLMRKYAGYAVMSHTWLQNEPEVTFSTWPSIQGHRGAGYEKLEGFCKIVAKDLGVSLAWMDTVCINKDSSSELDESIRSMYRWYRDASICVTYLADTSSLDDMARDRWFTRGWTLQELVAPRKIQFYNKTWTRLGFGDSDKEHRQILWVIEAATGITHLELSEFTPGVGDHDAGGLSRRMVWAANRTTARGEDTAYSLMGIFGVSISIAYGEGAERAFFRLIEAILTTFKDVFDVLNWAGRPTSPNIHSSRLIPSSPRCFLHHVNTDTWPSMKGWKSRVPLLESIGLIHHRMRVRLLLIAVWCDQLQAPAAPLPSLRGRDIRNLDFTGETILPYDSIANGDKSYPHFVLGGDYVNSLLGVWNFVEQQEDDVLIPEICLGVQLGLQNLQPVRRTDYSWLACLDPSGLHVNLNHNAKNLVTFKIQSPTSTTPAPYMAVKTKLYYNNLRVLLHTCSFRSIAVNKIT